MTIPFNVYALHDGTYVDVDATAAKGACVIDFTRADGAIVKAVLVRDECPRCDGDGFGQCGASCERCHGSGRVARGGTWSRP